MREPSRRAQLVFILGGLTAFGPLSIDMYLPALPSISCSFVGYALSCGLAFAAMFAYISGSPFVLQDIYGISPRTAGSASALLGVLQFAIGAAAAPLVGILVPGLLYLWRW